MILVNLLQVALGWYFGDSVPKNLPKPILVGGHMTHSYRHANFNRALIDGAPVQVCSLALIYTFYESLRAGDITGMVSVWP